VLVIGQSGDDVLTGGSSACEATASRAGRAKLRLIQRNAV